MHHLLPWVASCSLVMHHTWLSIMSHYVLCVYHVVYFFPVMLLLVSSCFVATVRIRSSTLGSSSWLHLLHGPVLLPSGISRKMTIPSKSLLSLLASCSLFCYATIPTTCFIMPPMLPCQASNPPCPSKPLFGYVTALLSPSYSVASCWWRWSLFLVGTWLLLGYHYNILFTLMHLYTW